MLSEHWICVSGSWNEYINLESDHSLFKGNEVNKFPSELSKEILDDSWCTLLCPLNESPSRKREDLHDNATRKGREIYCWLKPGPLLQPTQWCKVREPRAPVSMHIYRVLDFKHKQWVVGTSGLVTCLQSNFIGTNFHARGTFQGTLSEVYWAQTD